MHRTDCPALRPRQSGGRGPRDEDRRGLRAVGCIDLDSARITTDKGAQGGIVRKGRRQKGVLQTLPLKSERQFGENPMENIQSF